jgi:prepilin-type N-terminal cleavage/methylation domain-containing protein
MKRGRTCAGFTLIELVISLLLISILSTAFLPIIRMTQQRSAETLIAAGRMYALQNQMEILVAAYAAETDGGGDVASFQLRVPTLLVDGITLEANDVVKEKDGGLVADDKDLLLLVTIRDNSGYRLRRLFSAKE